MKKSELRQLIKEEIQGILKENKEFQKIKREVDLMTDPRIQRGWVDFYMNRINGEKLKTIIKSICVGFDDSFYEYVDNLLSNDEDLPPMSSGSKLTSFYDFDTEYLTLSDEEGDALYGKMFSSYRKIINDIEIAKKIKNRFN